MLAHLYIKGFFFLIKELCFTNAVILITMHFPIYIRKRSKSIWLYFRKILLLLRRSTYSSSHKMPLTVFIHFKTYTSQFWGKT